MRSVAVCSISPDILHIVLLAEPLSPGLGELGAGAAALNLHVAYLSVRQVQTLFTSSFWQSIAATDSPEQTFFKPIGRKINYSSWWMTRYRYHLIR